MNKVTTLIIFLFVTSLFCAVTFSFSATEKHINKEIYVDWILKNSNKISRHTATDIYEKCMDTQTGLLMLAIAKRESNFNPAAISKAGAVGLNQIMASVWTETLVEEGIITESRDLFDYDKNILASDYIITLYYNQTGGWKKALRKYVGGHHNTYIKDVLSTYGELMLLNNVIVEEENNE